LVLQVPLQKSHRFHKFSSKVSENAFDFYEERQGNKERKIKEIREVFAAVKQLIGTMNATIKICQLFPDKRLQMIYDNKYPRVTFDYWKVPKEMTSPKGLVYMTRDLLAEGLIYQQRGAMG
jgi:hypothetical protein